MAEKWDEGRVALESIEPRSDLWQEAQARAARAEAAPASVGGVARRRRLTVAVAAAAAVVAAVVAVGVRQLGPDSGERVDVAEPGPGSTPTTGPPVTHDGGDPRACQLALRSVVAAAPLPEEEVIFPPEAQVAEQTVAFLDDDGVGVQIASPQVFVIDLVGERVEEVDLEQGPALLWLASDFVQVRARRGDGPCDSFSVTASGGTEAENRAAALSWADEVLLMDDLVERDDAGVPAP